MSFRVLTCYYRPKPGGFCKRLFRAMRALLDAGCEVHYLAVVPFPIEHPKCHFHRFPWPASRTDTLTFWLVFHVLAPWMLLYLGVRFRVTHTFAFGPTYSAIMQPMRWVRRIPLVVFLRGDTIRAHELKGRPRWVVLLDRGFEAFAIWGVKVCAVSEVLAETVVGRHRWFRPSSCEILRNDVASPSAGGALKIHSPLRLACLGILEPVKNQRLAIELCRRLSGRPLHLYLYGKGPDEIFLREMVRQSGVASMVTFGGWVDAATVWGSIDILLMPSLHEGAPNAVLEAMAHGIPIIASDIRAHAEILPTDSLVSLDNPEQWVARLESILGNPATELAKLRASQKEAAAALMFDWDRAVVDQILGESFTPERNRIESSV